MKKIILKAIVIAAVLSVPLMGAHSQDALQTEAEAAFRQADIINDGRIDRGEFDMYHQRAFRQLDRNDNGKMTMDECMGSCFTPTGDHGEAAPSGIVHYKFEDIDLNGSSEIEENEYILYARERFGDYDTDGDGTIDINEFCAFYRQSMPCTFRAFTPEMME